MKSMHIANDKKKHISGCVESIIFSNIENSFTVIRVKVPKYKDGIIVVGELPPLFVGEDIDAYGFWVSDKNYGLQFRVDSMQVIQPSSPLSIQKYLGSGLIKGIGPSFAKRLISAFGVNVLQIIENSPDRLMEIDGVGPKRKEMLVSGWHEQKIIREIMMFLYSHKIGPSRALKIYKKYGDAAISIVSKNPYKLSQDIDGIGFLSADKVALSIGFDKNSKFRIKAAINNCLFEFTSNGSCGMPKNTLIKNTIKILEFDSSMEDVIEKNILEEISNGELISSFISNEEIVFLKVFYIYELQIARLLIDIYRNKISSWMPSINDCSAFIELICHKLSINMNDAQKSAINLALTSKVLVITGGPGTGKTTILRAIVEFMKINNLSIKLCAPTGRAAKRMSDATQFDAFTVHKILGVDPATRKFVYNMNNKLVCDMIIIDEASMIDVQIGYSLLQAISSKASIIIVGDVDQLPSVRAGRFLQDIISSDVFPVVRLHEIFRQKNNSNIAINAHRVNKGLVPIQLSNIGTNKKLDFYIMHVEDKVHVSEKIINIATKRIPKVFGLNVKKDVCILSPMQKGITGVRNINSMMQNALTETLDLDSIVQYGQKFIIGDRVMQIENNYDKNVFNGELGNVKSINREDGVLDICFDDRIISYDFDELDQIILAYAITIHKSQGSEYPAVILPIMMEHYAMLKRNLIYTAITRGKELVIIVGEKKAIMLAVKTIDTAKRYSQLEGFLKAEIALIGANEKGKDKSKEIAYW